jgi:predicted DNA-binding transcriptional regulator AlpA
MDSSETETDGARKAGHPHSSGRSEMLIGTEEMCELLGVCRTALWTWRSSGKIPAPLRVSRRPVWWRRREIEDWIMAGMPPLAKWEWKGDGGEIPRQAARRKAYGRRAG